jgi:membrane associated rhomboid family serine protease
MKLWEDFKYQFNKGDSALRKTLIIMGVVFLFTVLVDIIAKFTVNPEVSDFLQYFVLRSNIGVTLIRPWTLITNIYMHGGFFHLIGNALWLFFIGRVFLEYNNNKRFFTVFIGGGIAGGLLYMISYNLFDAFAEIVGVSSLLGASGGVTAIIIGAAVLLPFYEFRPFGLFTIQLRWIAIIRLATDFISLPDLDNTGGTLAHLGGALFGFLYMKHVKGDLNIPVFDMKLKWPKWFNRKPKMNIDERKYYKKKTGNPTSAPPENPNQAEIDAILDKISQSGYNSLSQTEKDKLFKASQ